MWIHPTCIYSQSRLVQAEHGAGMRKAHTLSAHRSRSVSMSTSSNGGTKRRAALVLAAAVLAVASLGALSAQVSGAKATATLNPQCPHP